MSGAEIGLLNLRLRVFQGESLGDFPLTPACPIEKVILWESLLFSCQDPKAKFQSRVMIITVILFSLVPLDKGFKR